MDLVDGKQASLPQMVSDIAQDLLLVAATREVGQALDRDDGQVELLVQIEVPHICLDKSRAARHVQSRGCQLLPG